MLRTLAGMGRNLHNKRKSPRVADESMFIREVNNGEELQMFARNMDRISQSRWLNRFSMIFRAPFSLLSCFSPHDHHVDEGADGYWVTRGDFARASDANHHLMVNDSLRYAFLM